MQKKIVLITGAGASKELNISCGKDFLWEMASRLCTRHNLDQNGNFKCCEGKYHDMINHFLKFKGINLDYKTYNKLQTNEAYWINKINLFKDEFENYIDGPNSGTIDYFLQNQIDTEFVDIGKFALSFHLIGYEDAILQKKLYDSNSHWLGVFIEKHIENIYKNNEQSFKIITFNYDRTIEYYIYQHLTEKLSIPETDAISFIDFRLEVIHVYGKIGNLEWQNKTDYVKFGEKNDESKFVEYAIKNIQLIGSRVDCDTQKRINDILENPDKIFFLGYGFDKDNNSLLKIASSVEIIYTKYGLTNEYIKSNIEGSYRSNLKKGFDKKCVDLIQCDFDLN